MKIDKKRALKAGIITAAGAGLIIALKKDLFMYGLISKNQLDDDIIRVVKSLGGGLNAALLLAETAAAESLYGDAIDIYPNSGFGVFQFDRIGMEDTINRTSDANKQKIKTEFGVNIDTITDWKLKYSPLRGALLCRLFYLLRPGNIPDTVEKRAAYWKKCYNTSAGKGTEAGYIQKAAKYQRPRIIQAFS